MGNIMFDSSIGTIHNKIRNYLRSATKYCSAISFELLCQIIAQTSVSS